MHKSVLLKEDLEKIQTLCLIGFSDPSIWEELQDWLSCPDHTLFWIGSFTKSHVLDPVCPIHFISCEEGECDFAAFKEHLLQMPFEQIHYVIAPDLSKKELALLKQVKDRCQLIEWHLQLERSEVQDFGVRVLKNACKNREKKASFEGFSKAEGVLKGLPALICGAGPSLQKELLQLREISNRAVLFAGGAALSELSKNEVFIHIAAGIDPDPSYERCLMQGSFEAPFFYQSRFSSSLLDTVQGPLFPVPSSSHFAMEHWLEKDARAFDGGPTVSTFAFALAVHLGCNPIVFVGMDLAYMDEKTKYRELSGQTEFCSPISYQQEYTQKDWVLAAKWIEHQLERTPFISCYTLSSSGLSIKGVCKTTLQELLASELQHSYDVEGALQVLKNCRSFSTGDEKKILQDLKRSLHRCLSIVQDLLKLFEIHYPEDPSSKGVFVLELFTLYEEIVYQNLLQPLWKVWRLSIESKIKDPYGRQLSELLFFKKVIEEHLLD
jgi:hypothetical protein